MFNRPTVLIVGAGASAEVGMPVGTKLIGLIKNRAEQCAKKEFSSEHVKELCHTAVKYIFKGDWDEFSIKCEQIAIGLRHAISIDNFLDVRKDETNLVSLGKLFISLEIVLAEESSALSRKAANSIFKEQAMIDTSWYHKFFQRLHLNTAKSDIQNLFKNVTIINFNYDRTLKHYLWHAVKEYYGVHHAEAVQAVNALKELRPYGKIGRLPWEGADGISRPLGYGEVNEIFRDAETNIYTFMESKTPYAIGLSDIKDALNEAERYIFIGFAFHEQNMKLLFHNFKPAKIKQIYATTYEMTEPLFSDASGQFRSMLERTGRSAYSLNAKCGEFFDHFGPQLSS